MNPLGIAAKEPEWKAITLVGEPAAVTYATLADRIGRASNLFRALQLQRGDHIALLMENGAEFLSVCWAATVSGLYYTPISTHLRPDEVAYILKDCGARLFVASSTFAVTAAEAANAAGTRHRLARGPVAGFEDWDEALARSDSAFAPAGAEGLDMLYSSGTTGQPKGVKRPLPSEAGPGALGQLRSSMFGVGPDTCLLSPAPLYHAAPLRLCMATLRAGGHVVLLAAFDAEACLASIERHGVTHAQFVPTMFNRLLKLPDATRAAYDTSSLRLAIHAAAPCPAPVKEQMIAWWGPILFEYYGGTEGNGICAIDSEEWLAHRGSVGRAKLGRLRILDDQGRELPHRAVGAVYFEGGPAFEYHNDPEKTRQSRSERGWTTLGDVGYVDEDGYLYLVDRKCFTIVSGGVNIYPQEVEDVLSAHDAVADAAVFGVPNEDFGEEVKAVVELRPGLVGDEVLAAELMDYCRARLSKLKAPRSVDFTSALPRTPTGKLHKKPLRDAYWVGRETRII